jgi:hypothetical protein
MRLQFLIASPTRKWLWGKMRALEQCGSVRSGRYSPSVPAISRFELSRFSAIFSHSSFLLAVHRRGFGRIQLTSWISQHVSDSTWPFPLRQQRQLKLIPLTFNAQALLLLVLVKSAHDVTWVGSHRPLDVSRHCKCFARCVQEVKCWSYLRRQGARAAEAHTQASCTNFTALGQGTGVRLQYFGVRFPLPG